MNRCNLPSLSSRHFPSWDAKVASQPLPEGANVCHFSSAPSHPQGHRHRDYILFVMQSPALCLVDSRCSINMCPVTDKCKKEGGNEWKERERGRRVGERSKFWAFLSGQPPPASLFTRSEHLLVKREPRESSSPLLGPGPSPTHLPDDSPHPTPTLFLLFPYCTRSFHNPGLCSLRFFCPEAPSLGQPTRQECLLTDPLGPSSRVRPCLLGDFLSPEGESLAPACSSSSAFSWAPQSLTPSESQGAQWLLAGKPPAPAPRAQVNLLSASRSALRLPPMQDVDGCPSSDQPASPLPPPPGRHFIQVPPLCEGGGRKRGNPVALRTHNMPSSVPRASSSVSFVPRTIPNLQMRRLRLREMQGLEQGHTDGTGKSWS